MKLGKRTLHAKPTQEEFGIKLKSGGSAGGSSTGGSSAGGSGTGSTGGGVGGKGTGVSGTGGSQPREGGAGKKILAALVLLVAGAAVIWYMSKDPDVDPNTNSASDKGQTDSTSVSSEDIYVQEDSAVSSAEETSGSGTEENEETTGTEENEEATETASVWDQAVSEVSQPGSVWQTVSSIAAKKQFCGDRIMHFAGGEYEQYAYELVSVTNLTGIYDDHGDGVKYVYVTNTGNQYYLYEDNADFLECRWEPDGYSASDSLDKISDNITENTEIVNVSADGSEEVTFSVRSISVFSGYYNDDEKEKCLAANLEQPVLIKTANAENLIALHSVQIYGEAVDQFIEDRDLSFEIGEADGYVVENSGMQLTGKLWTAETNHHYTPVLMQITGGME